MKEYDDIYIDSLSVNELLVSIADLLDSYVRMVGKAFEIYDGLKETKNGEIRLKKARDLLLEASRFRVGLAKQLDIGRKPDVEFVYEFYEDTRDSTLMLFSRYIKRINSYPRYDASDKSAIATIADDFVSELDALNKELNKLHQWPEFVDVTELKLS